MAPLWEIDRAAVDLENAPCWIRTNDRLLRRQAVAAQIGSPDWLCSLPLCLAREICVKRWPLNKAHGSRGGYCACSRTSPHQQAAGCLCLHAGGILIEVTLQGGKGAMAAYLCRLMRAQSSLVGGGESGLGLSAQGLKNVLSCIYICVLAVPTAQA